MYAISFDLTIGELKKHYGEPYNNAYFEVRMLLKKCGFEWTQGTDNNLATVYKAINSLHKTEWYRKSLRDIRAFKVEDWSDFTEIVQPE